MPQPSWIPVAMACVCLWAFHFALSPGAGSAGDTFLGPRAVARYGPVELTSSISSQRRGQALGACFGAGSEMLIVSSAAAAAVMAASAIGMRRRGQLVRRRAVDLSTFVMTGSQLSPQALPPGSKKEYIDYVQNKVIPSGEAGPTLTDEEAEEFLDKRSEKLREMMPQSDIEFEDEVDEMKWLWARHLLPFSDPQRHQIAAHKARTILRQQDFFKKLRLFQPVALKHPTLLKRFIKRDIQDLECKGMKVNAHFIHNEEKIAGFTYEDWATATGGNKYEDWQQPKVGDLVTGVVAAMNQDGAFIEIGAKTWALLPLLDISLTAIGSPGEVLKIGEEVEARIVKADAESMVYGDGHATQYVLSRTELLRAKAWDEITDIMACVEGTSPLMEVEVRQMRPYGAVVQTESGLEGVIFNMELADKVGDTGILGTKILVELKTASREGAELGTDRFPLTFSYKNAATKELAMKLQEGDVVDAKVVDIRDASIDVMIDGTQCQVRKIDLSGERTYNIEDVFDIDMDIKLAVLSVEPKSGEIRLSMRALERKRGDVIKNMPVVIAKAEKTAKKYFTKMSAEKARLEKSLDSAFNGGGDIGDSGLSDLDDDSMF